jgi:hypothetical protein
VSTVLTVQRIRNRGKGTWRGRFNRNHIRNQDDSGDLVMSRDDRLIWLSIALVAGVDGGVLAGLLTAVAGGSKQAALGAGGVAALGTFGTVLTVIRFLNSSSQK